MLPGPALPAHVGSLSCRTRQPGFRRLETKDSCRQAQGSSADSSLVQQQPAARRRQTPSTPSAMRAPPSVEMMDSIGAPRSRFDGAGKRDTSSGRAWVQTVAAVMKAASGARSIGCRQRRASVTEPW